MAILTIPTTADPFYVQRTDLEGREYVLTFDYSTREGVWYLTIADDTETVLAAGVKLTVGLPLLYRFKDARMPPGLLFVYSSTGDDSPPGLADLAPGGRCTLDYMTSDELG